MFEYGFINLIYVSENCWELELVLKTIIEAIISLKKVTKTKKSIYAKFLTTCPVYYNNKWYPAMHMI